MISISGQVLLSCACSNGMTSLHEWMKNSVCGAVVKLLSVFQPILESGRIVFQKPDCLKVLILRDEENKRQNFAKCYRFQDTAILLFIKQNKKNSIFYFFNTQLFKCSPCLKGRSSITYCNMADKKYLFERIYFWVLLFK